MHERRSDYDVTNRVKTTDAATVGAEVRRIYLDLHRKADVAALNRAFTDFAALYRWRQGEGGDRVGHRPHFKNAQFL